MHISIIEGDYLFNSWDEGEPERYYSKERCLLDDGFVLKDTHSDWLNEYRVFENSNGEKVTLTILCN